MIYMDHNATTPLHPAVLAAMLETAKIYGNPSSRHAPGSLARAMLDNCRAQIASFINAEPDEIIFCASGSEANNMVMNSFESCLISSIEHPSISAHSAAQIRVDRHGTVDMDDLAAKLKQRPQLVSIILANNEIGTIQNIKGISKLVHDNGARLHSDGVQAVGKIPIDVKALKLDYLSFSAHKIYGPRGSAVLFVRQGAPIKPLIMGGGQEYGLRSGTENLMAIAGFAKALELRAADMEHEAQALCTMHRMLLEGLSRISDVYITGHPENCLPGTINAAFMGAEGERIVDCLSDAGFAVSTGSACSSGSFEPSHVLEACNTPCEYARGAIRISLGRSNTIRHIQALLKILPQVVDRVRCEI